MSRVYPACPLSPRDYDRLETERLPLDFSGLSDFSEMDTFEAHPNVGDVRNNGPELLRKAAVAT